MRLKYIKLAGFKSFVDPTKVPFEQQMTAIVGPNGCGKSNIIDAVRWVLGESSAKNLRGDAMTDVIFNGAETRKSVGIASVELLFDNVVGRIAGHLADRNQISIKRSVNRDSVNSYYLNGTKCRRKDITDIFLGTGLGPRSYAIIEQGTISRLIESKPQELRVFIEEAAGISKYKERRRDTENRIRHTRENLERLNDIRFELGLQIDKLHQQSEAAKRYRTLKQQERTYKAELAVIRWQSFSQQKQKAQALLSKCQQEAELLVLHEKSLVIALDKSKQSLAIDNEEMQALQQEKIQLTNDIARTEQSIKHQKQQLTQVDKDNDFAKQQLDASQKQLVVENQRLVELAASQASYIPKQETNEKLLAKCNEQLRQVAKKQQEVAQQWQKELEQQSQSQQHYTKAESAVNSQQALLKRTLALRDEITEKLKVVSAQPIGKQQALSEEVVASKSILAALEVSIKEAEESAADTQQALLVNNEALASAKGKKQALQTSFEQLSDMQNDNSDWQEVQQQWLVNECGISSYDDLLANITVENGWEKAVEAVLLPWLQAKVVDQLPSRINIDKVLLLKKQTILPASKGTVAAKIGNLSVNFAFLNTIYTAETLKEAQILLLTLSEDSSVICRDGTWIGHHFICRGESSANDGYLLRNKQLTDVEEQIEQTDHVIKGIITAIEGLTKGLNSQQSDIIQLKQKFAEEQSVHQNKTREELLVKQALEQQQQQSKLLNQELNNINIQIADEQQTLTGLQHELTQHRVLDDGALRNLEEEKLALAETLELTQTESNKQHNERHQLSLAVEQLKNDKFQREQAISRLQESIDQFTLQLQRNKQLVSSNSSPLQHDEMQLQKWLLAMVNVDERIAKLNSKLLAFQQDNTRIEIEQKETTEKLSALKENIASHHVNSESYRLRAESALEVLGEMQKSVSEVKSSLPDNAKEGLWQANIAKLSKDISTLGPINLAAIEEYESQLARKNHLDSQNDDLILAINTLESAIEKIDQETRQKFITTFEQVNSDLKALFPKVFGGGMAYLALTGDDMLETGVTIMARPPGKKNSTIHLLSGGEKALTALSLVFAIFRLNPAPFCMLDEVDAPLDDANVSRFCNLVREMSQTVQFIYISHNKIAMEMASHLTGVTMFEAGVSKMVAVDIDEAVAMAEIT